LQQGQKIRKWEERARVGIYLGPSLQHAKSVALVLLLFTGNVSPQYHVQFDDLFETVTKENEQYIPKLEWQVKAHFQKAARNSKAPTISVTTPDISILPLQIQPPAPQLTSEFEQFIVDQPLPEPEFEHAITEPVVELEAPLQEQQQEQIQQPVRCSTRQRRAPAHFADYIPHSQVSFQALLEPEPDPVDRQLQAFITSSDPDVMYLWQAMREPDWPQFQAAMQHEIEDHKNNGHWEIVLRSTIPKPTVWYMKHKRRIITREVYQWKAHLTIDGSKQQYGLHYDQTYSPVVTWATTCFFLIHSILHSWYSHQLDFLLAYMQAPVEREL
jgi:hypothetical protein